MKKMRKGFFMAMLFILVCQIFNSSSTAKAEEKLVLKVKSATMTSVTLSWKSKEKSCIIYRSEKRDGTYKKIAAVKGNTYKNTNLSSGKSYYYQVKTGGMKSNIVKKVKVKGFDKTGSVYGKALSQKQRNQVGDKVANFVNTKIKGGMTEFEKVKTAHDYIVKTCDVAKDWRYNGANTAWGALVYKEAQCSGYARAFKAICDAMGIGCYHVHANSKAINPSHQWNMVKVDGKWYHIDLNCNDNSGFYAVFLLGDKELKQSVLMDWDKSKYPKCSESYNFEELY